jgi:hypothetical protein
MPRFQTLHRLLLGGLAPVLAGLITLTAPAMAQGATPLRSLSLPAGTTP